MLTLLNQDNNTMTDNIQQHLPKFSNIDLGVVEQQLGSTLHRNKEKISNLLQQESFSWDNFLAPIQELEETLNNLFKKLWFL